MYWFGGFFSPHSKALCLQQVPTQTTQATRTDEQHTDGPTDTTTSSERRRGGGEKGPRTREGGEEREPTEGQGPGTERRETGAGGKGRGEGPEGQERRAGGPHARMAASTASAATRWQVAPSLW